MNRLFSTLFLVTRRFLLIGVYAIFFCVQFFVNFGADNSMSVVKEVSHQINDTHKKYLASKKSPDKKSTIRLNKRFQPGIVPAMTYTNEEIPVKFLKLDNSVKPNDYLLISFILASSLRGPPALS